MKECNRFLIIANETKDIDLKYSNQVLELIRKNGGSAELSVGVDDKKQVSDDIDAVIVMGGDGTMLRVAHMLSGRSTPVVGVNLGTVGFLTEVVTTEIENMVKRLMIGDYTLEERMLLSGRIIRAMHVEETGQKIEAAHANETAQVVANTGTGADFDTVYTALNEVVLARENTLRLIAVRIYVNGDYFDTCEADGILIATPTGSTGYNLSAGGPIVMPDAKMLVLTPISPYSLTRRSVILGANDIITLELLQKRKDTPNSGLVSFDGAQNVHVQVGDMVEIKTSESVLELIKFEKNSVYEILRKKIGG